MNLEFQVALDELKLHQPRFQGEIGVSQGDLFYKPKNLRLKTDVDLTFTDQALSIKNVKYASGASTLLIDGEVENFFSLFYDAPEKMVVALNVRSPFLNAKTFLGTEISSKGAVPLDSAAKEGATRKLRSVIDKCQMVLNMQIDKAVYEHLEATNARAQIVLANGRVNVKNGSIETSGGKFVFDAHLAPQGDVDVFGAKVKITSCDIPRLLKSFNNFGITAFAPENITGDLSADASVSRFPDFGRRPDRRLPQGRSEVSDRQRVPDGLRAAHRGWEKVLREIALREEKPQRTLRLASWRGTSKSTAIGWTWTFSASARTS